MKRIAIYQRGYVSEEEQKSMSNFISAIPNAKLTAIFWDKDGSNRSQFRELIAAVKAGSIDAIIAQSLMRFTPNGELCLGVLKELHQRNVRIWFAREQFWNTELMGWLVIGSMMGMSEELVTGGVQGSGEAITTLPVNALAI